MRRVEANKVPHSRQSAAVAFCSLAQQPITVTCQLEQRDRKQMHDSSAPKEAKEEIPTGVEECGLDGSGTKAQKN